MFMRKTTLIMMLFFAAISVANASRCVAQTTQTKQEYEAARDEMIKDVKNRSMEDARISIKMEPAVVFLIIVVVGSGICAYIMWSSRKRSEKSRMKNKPGAKIKKVEKSHYVKHSGSESMKSSGASPPSRHHSNSGQTISRSDGEDATSHHREDKVKVRIKYGSAPNKDQSGNEKKLKKVRTRKRTSK